PDHVTSDVPWIKLVRTRAREIANMVVLVPFHGGGQVIVLSDNRVTSRAGAKLEVGPGETLHYFAAVNALCVVLGSVLPYHRHRHQSLRPAGTVLVVKCILLRPLGGTTI